MISVFRSAAVVGFHTALSRILGFCRDVLLASVLGAGGVMDAFAIAFRLPNIFRRSLAEGAFSAAFVPLLSGFRVEGEFSSRRFVSETLSLLFAFLAILTAVAEAVMPLLLMGLAPGFLSSPETFGLATELSRIAFPYLGMMSLSALLSGILNSHGRFALAASSPTLLNVVLISVLLWAGLRGLERGDSDVARLAMWGVFVSGVFQVLILGLAARRCGYDLLPRRPRMTDGMVRLVRLGVPGLVAGGVSQLNLLVGSMIASLQVGAVSWLYYAERAAHLPLGMIAAASAVALLPTLSSAVRGGRLFEANSALNRAVEFSFLATLPAAIGLAVLSESLIRGLFARGAFGESDVLACASALMAFSVGIPALTAIKVLSPAFFAREETRIPMRCAMIGAGVNVVTSLVLFPFLGHVGIASATSFAAWFQAILLYGWLRRLDVFRVDSILVRRVPRILFASVLMGVTLPFADSIAGSLTDHALSRILLTVGWGVLFFACASVFSGAARLDELRAALSRRSEEDV